MLLSCLHSKNLRVKQHATSPVKVRLQARGTAGKCSCLLTVGWLGGKQPAAQSAAICRRRPVCTVRHVRGFVRCHAPPPPIPRKRRKCVECKREAQRQPAQMEKPVPA